MRVHPQDVQMLQHFLPHIQLIITTGQDLRSVKTILSENGLFSNQTLPLPGVFMNDGVTCRPGEEVFEMHALMP